METTNDTPTDLEQTLLSLFRETNCVHIAHSDEDAARNHCRKLCAFLMAHGKTAGLVAGGTPIEGEAAAFRYDTAEDAFIPAERRAAYKSNVVFGSAITFGFDYLRDTLSDAPALTDRDALILPDANCLRTDTNSPLLIIASDAENILPDERATALAAAKEKGRDFILDTAPDGSTAVVLLDERGNALPGRRLSNGIHEALEIREGIPAKPIQQTLAQITLPEFAALYRKRF